MTEAELREDLVSPSAGDREAKNEGQQKKRCRGPRAPAVDAARVEFDVAQTLPPAQARG